MHLGWSRLAVVALYGVASYAFCSPLFAQPTALGVYDWDQHLFYYGAVLKNVVEYGQMPFWNPWYCGGNVLWQNPQIALLSPVYPLTAFMPLALAMKVNILLHYWMGFIGMHLLLSRVVGLRSLPLVFFLATVFTASGGPAIHLLVGHSVFLPAFYLPFVVYFFLRSVQTGTVRGSLLAAIPIAMMVYNGGTHILPMAIAVVGMLAVVSAAALRQWRPLIFGVACCVAGLAYSAPKLIPVVAFVSSEQFWDTRPPIERPDLTTLEMAAGIYLDPEQKQRSRLPDQRHGWHEYGNYIGQIAALLIVASVFWVFGARRAPDYWLGLALAIATIVLFVWSLGDFSRFAPSSLASHLPLFSSFRIPSRYNIVFVLCGALTAGWALRSVAADTVSKSAGALVGTLAVLAAANLIATNRLLLADVFSVPPLAASFKPMGGPATLQLSEETNAYRDGSPMLTALMSDRTFFACYESLQLTRTATAEHPLVFTDGASQVSGIAFTPNRIEFSAIGGHQPTRVSLNQNYSSGWSSSAGVFTPTEAAMPGVTLAPGQTGRFAFVFVPDGLWAGTAIFVLAAALSVFLWRRSVDA
ncbi:MAG: hypothetical protein Q8O42_02195 [Acidobacteriota bacterium]|nr:hypothetical protein [Acidobacteriota bacterium]